MNQLWGKVVKVWIQKDDSDPEPRDVRVRTIRMRDVNTYLSSLGDERVLVAMSTGLCEGELDALHPASFDALAQATHELNTIPLLEAGTRKLERLEAVAPGAKQRFNQYLERNLPPSSPSSVEPASTPSATGLTTTLPPSPAS